MQTDEEYFCDNDDNNNDDDGDDDDDDDVDDDDIGDYVRTGAWNSSIFLSRRFRRSIKFLDRSSLE